ncbi:MAG TPA: hypothetical protein VFY14_11180, partial [Streptomyces sp.]|nr:hypothetical protein [Streptomyces sp.]
RLRSQEQDATRHLCPPRDTARRLLWSVRHAHRNRVLRRDHDATMERLRTEMLSAYRRFRDQAADLTTYIEAERERRQREEKEHEERVRQKRAEALANPDVPQWAYCIVESARLKYRCFRVRLETLDSDRPGVGEAGGEARGGLTPREVHAALVEERKQDPYLWLTFNFETRLALKEWRGSTAKAWQEITGHRVAEHPIRPEDHRTSRPDDRRTSRRSYGPSSNYFSPGGFGTF